MKQKLKTNWLERQPLDTITSWVVLANDHGENFSWCLELFSFCLELLDKGLEFSGSWMLNHPNPYRGGPRDFYRSIATYLARFRLVDEFLDGLTTYNLVTMLADGC